MLLRIRRHWQWRHPHRTLRGICNLFIENNLQESHNFRYPFRSQFRSGLNHTCRANWASGGRLADRSSSPGWPSRSSRSLPGLVPDRARLLAVRSCTVLWPARSSASSPHWDVASLDETVETERYTWVITVTVARDFSEELFRSRGRASGTTAGAGRPCGPGQAPAVTPPRSSGGACSSRPALDAPVRARHGHDRGGSGGGACSTREDRRCRFDCRRSSCCTRRVAGSSRCCSRNRRATHGGRGAGQAPGIRRPRGANHPSRKIARRTRHVSACAACATQARTRCSNSPRVTVPARQRSRSPRSRLRKRRTFASGSRRRPTGSSSYPRNLDGAAVDATCVIAGCSDSRRRARNVSARSASRQAAPGRRRTARSRDGRIVSTGAQDATPVPDGAETLDLSGKTIMPVW